MLSNSQKQPSEEPSEARKLIGRMSEEEIDYNLMESFPASDPPSWTLGISRRKKSTGEFEEEEKNLPERISDKRGISRDRLW